jgi:hypothetical protein
MSVDSVATKSEAFWRWFQSNLTAFSRLENPDEPFWDEALAQLKQVDTGLWFELSRGEDERELVITAEGKSELFPIVDTLVARAPQVAGWRFAALKPAMGFDFVTTYEGVRFDAAEMWFRPLTSPSRPSELGLRIGVPDLNPSIKRQAENAVLIILDTALGERDAATAVNHVEVVPLPDSPEAERYIALPSLQRYLEWRKQRTPNA